MHGHGSITNNCTTSHVIFYILLTLIQLHVQFLVFGLKVKFCTAICSYIENYLCPHAQLPTEQHIKELNYDTSDWLANSKVNIVKHCKTNSQQKSFHLEHKLFWLSRSCLNIVNIPRKNPFSVD